MSTEQGKIIADFTTSLATSIAVGGETATLQSATDDDSVALPTGTYYFTIDGTNSSKEHIKCTLTSTALTSIKSVSRQGVESTGVARAHRLGATVTLTNFKYIKTVNDLLDGTTDLNASVPLKYDADPSLTLDAEIATKKYVDDVAIAGAADASTSTKGISKMSTAPASASNPIAVGDNDPRVPTADENDALAGTSGSPSASNKYVTAEDVATSSTADKIVRADANGLIDASWITASETSFTAGAAITAGDALHLSPYTQTDGGITLDTQSVTAYSNATNQSKSFTVGANSNRCLLVAVTTGGATPSAVTYNSVAMTLVDTENINAGKLHVYRLIAPSTGANNITVTSTAIYAIGGASYYNVDQTTDVEASAKNTANASTTSQTLATATAGSFIHVFTGAVGSGTISTLVSGASSLYDSSAAGTAIEDMTTGQFGLGSATCFSFEKTITSTVTTTISGLSGTVYTSLIAVSLKPAAVASTLGVVPADASNRKTNEPHINFVGIAETTEAIGATVSAQISPIVSGLSGLTPGLTYYLSDTPGALSTSRGTYGKEIGIALSSTTLLISRNKTTGAQIAKTANYTYTAETDGIAQITVPASTTCDITTDSIANQGISPASTATIVTVPVSKGKTYIASSSSTNVYFTPLA